MFILQETKILQRACVSKLQSDWDSYKLMKKELQRECRKEYNNYINNLVSEDDSPTSKNYGPLLKSKDVTTVELPH